MTGLVGIPCAEQGRYSAFWASVVGLDLPAGWRIYQGQGHSVASNRNGIIRTAIAEGRDWVFFLDDDLIVPNEALTTLLSTEQEAVVGLSFRRHPDFEPLWFHTFATSGDVGLHLEDIPAPDSGYLTPLAWATAGGLLISTRALRKMEDPWFTLGQHGADKWNDDFDFFLKLHASGTPLMGCSAVRFGHITSVDVWPSFREGQWHAKLARGHRIFAEYRLIKETVCDE